MLTQGFRLAIPAADGGGSLQLPTSAKKQTAIQRL